MRIKWELVSKAMLPVEAKAKKIDVELFGLGLIENAHHRAGLNEAHVTTRSSVSTSSGEDIPIIQTELGGYNLQSGAMRYLNLTLLQ